MLLREKAATVIDFGRLPDDRDEIRRALYEASAAADVVVTSGGGVRRRSGLRQGCG